MTKKRSYTTLRKKLQELEAELQFFYTLPPPEIQESGGHLLHDPLQLHAEEIQQHFIFLRNLLKAEINSAQSNPHRLHKFMEKIAKLENDFRNWESSASAIAPPVENADSVSAFSSDDEADSVRSNATGQDYTDVDAQAVSEISGYRCGGPWLHGELGCSEHDGVSEEGNYKDGLMDNNGLVQIEEDKKGMKVKSQGIVKERRKKKKKKEGLVDSNGLVHIGEEDKLKGMEVKTQGIVKEKNMEKKGRFGFIRYGVVFVSGVVFGSIMTNLAMVDFYPFISNAQEFLIPT